MDRIIVAPWLLPAEPDLARLAMEVADDAGLATLAGWPEARKGGVGFQDLPPFLTWSGQTAGRQHLVLVQPREVGGLVPGARRPDLPVDWLEALDLEALAAPLARHPALGGAASVHVVRLEGPGRAVVRTLGEPAGDLVMAVLVQLSGLAEWTLR